MKVTTKNSKMAQQTQVSKFKDNQWLQKRIKGCSIWSSVTPISLTDVLSSHFTVL